MRKLLLILAIAPVALQNAITFKNNDSSNFKFAKFKIYVKHNNHSYILGSAKGTSGFWLIDTGWERAAIKHNLATTIGSKDCYSNMGTQYCRHDATFTAQLKDINKATILVPNATGTTLNPSWETWNRQANGQTFSLIGILGYAIFENYVIKLDYQNNLLTVYDPTYFHSQANALDSFTELKSYFDGHTFMLPIKLNSQYIGQMKFDTGNPDTFISSTVNRSADTYTISTQDTNNNSIKLNEQYVRKAKASNTFVTGTAGDLGYSSMAGHIFILDYPSRKIYIKTSN